MTEDRQFNWVTRHIFDTLKALKITFDDLLGQRDFDISKNIYLGNPIWLDQHCARLIENDSWSLNFHVGFELIKGEDLSKLLLGLACKFKVDHGLF